MHMLANHVFDLSENIDALKRDVATSRRTLDFVSDNQREMSTSMRAMGEDMEHLGGGFKVMRENQIRLEGTVERLDTTLAETRNELNMLREDVNVLKRDMVEMRREQQSNFNELKGMISLMLNGVSGYRG